MAQKKCRSFALNELCTHSFSPPPLPIHPAGANCLGILAIFGWCGGCSLVMFGALRAAGMLRVDEETEKSGNDIPKHGEAAYPADAWVEMQYKKNVKEARRNSTLPPHMVSRLQVCLHARTIIT